MIKDIKDTLTENRKRLKVLEEQTSNIRSIVKARIDDQNKYEELIKEY